MDTSPPIAVTAFVDWNTQIHNARVPDAPPADRARRTLRQTARVIGRALARTQPTGRFEVAFRLYHGWHKGWERTENYRAITTTVSQTDFFRLSPSPNVVFSPDVRYGHTLLSALRGRQHAQPPIHLANTLRQQNRDEEPTEKMVDTALGADLLSWARRDPRQWALILSEDDDIVPSVFAAEAWTKPHGGRVYIVRSRARGRYLRLDGLMMEVSR